MNFAVIPLVAGCISFPIAIACVISINLRRTGTSWAELRAAWKGGRQ